MYKYLTPLTVYVWALGTEVKCAQLRRLHTDSPLKSMTFSSCSHSLNLPIIACEVDMINLIDSFRYNVASAAPGRYLAEGMQQTACFF